MGHQNGGENTASCDNGCASSGIGAPELTSAVTALANAIACRLTPDELAILSTVFVQLGDTLATIATIKSLCTDQTENDG